MDPASAERTKYVAHTMLALRVSSMSEVANLCERVGADVHAVRRGVRSDARIGPRFPSAGPGFGGLVTVGRNRWSGAELRELGSLSEGIGVAA